MLSSGITILSWLHNIYSWRRDIRASVWSIRNLCWSTMCRPVIRAVIRAFWCPTTPPKMFTCTLKHRPPLISTLLTIAWLPVDHWHSVKARISMYCARHVVIRNQPSNGLQLANALLPTIIITLTVDVCKSKVSAMNMCTSISVWPAIPSDWITSALP